MIGDGNLVAAETADVDEVHVGVGIDGGFELEEKGVVVGDEGPAGGATVSADGEVVGDDDSAGVAGGVGAGRGGVGVGVGEVGDEAGGGDDAWDPAIEVAEGWWIAGDQL